MCNTAQLAHQLVFTVAEKSFNGMLPDDAGLVVDSILMTAFADASIEMRSRISPFLSEAVTRYLRMQNSEFLA